MSAVEHAAGAVGDVGDQPGHTRGRESPQLARIVDRPHVEAHPELARPADQPVRAPAREQVGAGVERAVAVVVCELEGPVQIGDPGRQQRCGDRGLEGADVFFPIGTTGPALEQIETARRICTACTVADECLEFALATNQEAGIWGGTTEEERRKLRKAWLAKQRATA